MPSRETWKQAADAGRQVKPHGRALVALMPFAWRPEGWMSQTAAKPLIPRVLARVDRRRVRDRFYAGQSQPAAGLHDGEGEGSLGNVAIGHQ